MLLITICIYIVSLEHTPAIAWSEICGSVGVASSAFESSSSSAAARSRRKMRWQTRLWPRPNFSLQLKQRPRRRRSSISAWDRRFTGRPSTVAVGAAGVAAEGGAGSTRRGGGAGRMPFCCSRPVRGVVVELQLAGEAHGDSEGLRVVDLDVEAEGRQQPGG